MAWSECLLKERMSHQRAIRVRPRRLECLVRTAMDGRLHERVASVQDEASTS